MALDGVAARVGRRPRSRGAEHARAAPAAAARSFEELRETYDGWIRDPGVRVAPSCGPGSAACGIAYGEGQLARAAHVGSACTNDPLPADTFWLTTVVPHSL